MAQIRLIALDLDGTLLDNQKKVSPRNREALEKAAALGVYVVPVTGRPYHGIPKEVHTLPFVQYCISCNGANIQDKNHVEPFRQRLIPSDIALKIDGLLRGEAVGYEVLTDGHGYAEEGFYDWLLKDVPADSFLHRYVKETRRIVPHLGDFIRESKGLEECLLILDTADTAKKIAHKLQDIEGIHLVFPSPNAVEITALGVDKGEALLYLAASLGIERDEIMAMGDSGNDLALLQVAGVSVAMGNAWSKLKESATFVTESNDNDGVAVAVERFVLEA